jgi:hypothetical protein
MLAPFMTFKIKIKKEKENNLMHILSRLWGWNLFSYKTKFNNLTGAGCFP